MYIPQVVWSTALIIPTRHLQPHENTQKTETHSCRIVFNIILKRVFTNDLFIILVHCITDCENIHYW